MASRTAPVRLGAPKRATRRLTVAVTGTSGTVGPTLLKRLAASPQVGRVRSVGRRPPEHGGRDVEFREADVRDRAAVERAVAGADVVVHMAYALYGMTPGEGDLYDTNVEGTLNVARAAAATGARRFVFVSSGVIYGFDWHNPQPLTEDAPLRPPARHFYARHKGESERRVADLLRGTGTDAYFLRPCAVVGPHAGGAAEGALPNPVVAAVKTSLRVAARLGLPVFPAPPVPLQFAHEDDVAQACELAAAGHGPPGVYNLAGDGVVPGRDVPRLLGMRPLPVPRAVMAGAVRLLAALPPVLPALGWTEAGTGPVLMDSSKARTKLGWRPRYSSHAALRSSRAGFGL